MTDLRKAAQDVLDKYDSYRETSCNETYSKDMEALRAALAETPEDMPPTCNPHPDAPHGFNRNASHSEDRYVCDCEGWEPSSETPEPVAYRHWCESDIDEAGNTVFDWEYYDKASCSECQPLYTTPPSVDALIAEAVAKEREACAQIGESFDRERPQSNYGRCIAVAIRARGGA